MSQLFTSAAGREVCLFRVACRSLCPNCSSHALRPFIPGGPFRFAAPLAWNVLSCLLERLGSQPSCSQVKHDQLREILRASSPKAVLSPLPQTPNFQLFSVSASNPSLPMGYSMVSVDFLFGGLVISWESREVVSS